jgi:signal transduction histidine kinase/putative methionine-R-sulfoxide reductase with GAF domain
MPASGEHLGRIEAEHAAVRRVATLVATQAPAAELFAAVVHEVMELLDVSGGWLFRYEPDGSVSVLASSNVPGYEVGRRYPLDGPSVSATVLETARPARIDDYEPLTGALASRARESGFRSGLGVPVIVDGMVWGLLSVGTKVDESLPDDAEARLRDFTELVAAAISNADARHGLSRVVVEQAALRRLATLVVERPPTEELFTAVREAVSHALDVAAATVWRYEPDGSVTVIAAGSDTGFPVGSRWPLDGSSVVATVFRTGRPARIDDYSQVFGTIADATRESEFSSVVGAPITVDGSVWGLITIATRESAPLPPDTASRLSDFTDLVATAISHIQAREDLQKLADEQAALRRVATLVAEGTALENVLAAVCEEAGRLLEVPAITLERYDPDNFIIMLASWGETGAWEDVGFRVGSRWPLDERKLARTVLETGRPVVITDYAELPNAIPALSRAAPRLAIASVPISVDGEIWGMISAATSDASTARLPDDTASRLTRFTGLIAIALSSAHARAELRGLAEEQAALRRIATLVADGAEAKTVFDAICTEAGQLVGASSTNLAQFTEDGSYVALAGWSLRSVHIPPGTRLPLGPDSLSAIVARTGAPARLDSYEGLTSELAALVRSRGIRSSVAAPILIEGRLWGAVIASKDTPEPFPAGAEERVARFAELAATAISNATARSELIASRARIVAAGDEARRRIERNLHDGIQQRLITLSLDLELARETIPPEFSDADAGLSRLSRELEEVLEDLRQLSRGLHPSLLSRAGLGPALAALARTSPIPVTLETNVAERLPQPVEIGIYYVVAEALTNAAKYSRADEIRVSVSRHGKTLGARIEDDGIGGADASGGSGLTGLMDRVAALGGSFAIDSRPGQGTQITVALLMDEEESESAG